jgi:hypothetical protein
MRVYGLFSSSWELTEADNFFRINVPILFFSRFGQNHLLPVDTASWTKFSDEWAHGMVDFDLMERVGVAIASTHCADWREQERVLPRAQWHEEGWEQTIGADQPLYSTRGARAGSSLSP